MKAIDIHCQGCGTITNVPWTPEIPENAKHLGCNWCPNCMDAAEDYYQEWVVKYGPRRPREQRTIENRFHQFKLSFDATTTQNTGQAANVQ